MLTLWNLVEGDHIMRNLILASAALATAATGIGLTFSTPAFAQAGSYQRSCRTYNSAGGVLTAECADAQGRYHSSSLNTGQCRGDISNQNGMLSCPGGQASGGQLVQNGQQQGGNRGQAQGYGGQGYGGQAQGYGGQGYNQGRNDRGDDHRDNRGNDAAAAFLGGVLGGALAGNGGVVAATPPAPPAYGDPRYGDPRYDWRYQQGGFGYGRRPGEWVPIRDRADWLNRQIDRLQQDGRIDYRDARDYRRQLDRIQDRERDMMRDGRIGGRERDELDRRFSELTEEIRHDARES
jgi:hypothetical protein